MKKGSRKPIVLLTGASGFIGRSILEAITARGENDLRILARPTTVLPESRKASIYVGDITDVDSLNSAIAGADTIVNAATYTGADALTATEVNSDGTGNLLDAAARNSVSRFIQISTTSVYGTGPHRGEGTSLPYAPESAASRSRASAERLVLNAGGSVIRTGLIYGQGDKWFIPALIRMAAVVGGPVGDGSSKLSVIDVGHLGQLISALVGPGLGAGISGPFHAAEPEPVSVERLLLEIQDKITGPLGSASTDFERSLILLLQSGFTSHQAALLSQDHWYESDRLWALTGLNPPAFTISAEAALWYRRFTKRY
ncbi:NAD(P)-dependent oxidoreductase [Arthrobacter sp.]|uniref:NAD-dependent epimerase/dehydratase family protein n=1 Tax=Arthrobacter sp. TaxID=1667 RepID=UPI00281163E2|nr:NAD(P)-dependent oxidoreductase [Arthrobacter sp.]